MGEVCQMLTAETVVAIRILQKVWVHRSYFAAAAAAADDDVVVVVEGMVAVGYWRS